MARDSEAFVRISDDGLHFQVADRPFFFAGANCYYLLTRGADSGLQHEVLEVLDAVQEAGLTVVRTWAFCDGSEWNSLQPFAGQFHEQVFQSLDWLIVEAKRRGLRILFALTNYGGAYGGMCQYVKWSCQRRKATETDKPEAFYSDSCCQDIFQNFIATITCRVNALTGRAYRDEPTILGWTLANEPRCDGDYSGSVLQEWIETTAEFLKSLDANHLICVGTEGFLGSSTPELLPDNPYDCMSQGCDFLRHHSCRAVDFATIHLWPDGWMPQASEDQKLNFARRWINCHVDLCTTTLRKPLVLAEFGKKPRGPIRAAFYEKVYGEVVRACLSNQAMAGSCLWMAAAPSYPDYDGNTVCLRRHRGREDDDVVAAIRKHAAAMNGFCQHPSHTAVLGRVLHHARSGHAMVGSCCWSVAHRTYPDYDGFTVFLHQPSPPAPPVAAGMPSGPAPGRSAAQAGEADRQGTGHSPAGGQGSAAPEAEPRPAPGAAGQLPRQQPRPGRSDGRTVALLRQHAADMAALSADAEQQCGIM